ncbi:hypothetical protein [Delftia acidovorans]|uniref:Uncharacterized protein n=1 Tax=Delftia acidovorans TaxID=80866 RepID=A0AAJ2R1D3_DELAC|nr:hypothetical protein [Delftia acidovorans]MDX4956240.1 hypothetical protein [Delftia acidovorans]
MPKHEWRGTELRFQKDPDTWGRWVDLRGPSSSSSVAVIQDSEGNDLKPERLPLVENVVMGDQMVMVRDGVFVRVKIVLSGIPTNAITVNGVPVTVNGEYVVLAE